MNVSTMAASTAARVVVSCAAAAVAVCLAVMRSRACYDELNTCVAERDRWICSHNQRGAVDPERVRAQCCARNRWRTTRAALCPRPCCQQNQISHGRRRCDASRQPQDKSCRSEIEAWGPRSGTHFYFKEQMQSSTVRFETV